jgi:predicted nicotinamide N-methyase
LLHDKGGGLAKWNYIVKKHIPDVSGMRVLDLGCSSGLFSIELARLGAREVIGIDRSAAIQHRSTTTPPAQDVIAQAGFVKRAFEMLDEVSYPITYIAHDIGRLKELALGRFDLVLALCVVYHEMEHMASLLEQLATMTDYLVLQANQAHGGKLGEYSNIASHVKELCRAGFTHLEIEAPLGYMLPIVVARK